jgi:hypothetical protein
MILAILLDPYMHDALMRNQMVGMFWAGVVMATPPMAIGIGLVVYLVRRKRHPDRR